MSNHLDLSQVAAAQNQKEVTINDQAGEIDAALTEDLPVLVDDTNAVTLTAGQFRRAFFLMIADDAPPPDGAITITVPAVQRGLFKVINTTAQSVTVEVSGQSEASPVVAAGGTMLLSCDGSDVRVAGGGGVEVFTDLTDTPGSYTGHGGKAVLVNGAEDGLAFVSLPYDFGFVKAATPTSSEVIGKVVIPRDITLPADFTGAAGHVDVHPDDAFDIDVTDDGVSIGTISISDAGAFTFTTASGTARSIGAGSVVRFVAPASTDASIEGIAATLVGTLD